MESKMLNLPTFTVVGKKEIFQMSNGKNLLKIPEIWRIANEKGGLVENLLAINDGNLKGVFGVSDITNTSVENQSFDYWIAVHSSHSADLTHIVIPAAKWISFEVDGMTPQSIQAGFQQIMTTELAELNIKEAMPYQLEYYPPHYVEKTSSLIEIWIPIEAL